MKKTTGLIVGLALAGAVLLLGGLIFIGARGEVLTCAVLLTVAGAVGAVLWANRARFSAVKPILRYVLPGVVVAMLVCNLTVNAAVGVNVDTSASTISDKFEVTASSGNKGDNKVTISGGKIEAKAVGYSTSSTDGCGNTTTKNHKDTVTVTVKAKGNMTFTLAVSGATITSGHAAGTVTMEKDATLTFTVTSGEGPNSSVTGSVTISNIEVESTDEVVTTTFKHRTGGTVTVDGATLTQTTAMEKNAGQTFTLSATAADGYVFKGWQSANNGLFTTDTYQCMSGSADTVWPVFIKSDSAMYYVQNASPRLYYGYFDEALTAAGNSGTVVVYQSGTLYGYSSQTEFTIGASQKLLVPYSATDSGIWGAITEENNPKSDANPTTYCTLTIPAGTTITCYGKINVNGQRNCTSQGTVGTGTAKGGHGKLVLAGSGTQLTINSGGVLTAYGFVTGPGGVTLDGGDLHELLQIYDWGGGSNLMGWYTSLGSSKNQTMFFTAHYYVQNVEAPLTVNYGSNMYVEAALTIADRLIVSSARIVSTSDNNNTEGLFLLGSGTRIIRTYSADTDRVEYALGGSGNVGFGSLKVNVYIGVTSTLGYSAELESSEFTLPLNNAMTVRVCSGVTMNMGNRVALMPGSRVIVDEGGVMNLTNHVYIFDKDDKVADLFFGDDLLAPKYTAGRGTTAKITTVTESARVEINGDLVLTGNGALYTTTSGSNTDKIVYGTGTITHKGTLGQGSLRGGYTSSFVTVSVGNGLANLAGYDVMTAFSSDTTNGIKYTGLGEDHNNYWYINSEEHEATCTENAYTAYWCTDATKTYNVEEADSATGHNYESVVTPPAVGQEGYTTHTCSACSDSYTDNRLPALVANVIYGTSVRAGDNLDIFFYINPNALTAGSGYTIKLVRTQYNGEDIEEVFAYDGLDESEGFKVVRHSFAAKEMTDTVSLTVYQTIDGKEVQISETKQESIASYAYRALDYYIDKDSKLCTALVDMLNYGTAAQQLWNYNPDKLANAELTDAEKAFASQEVEPVNDTKRVSGGTEFGLSATVTAESTLYFSFYFSGVPADAPVTISYTDHYGKNIETTGNLEETTIGGVTYYRIDVVGLAIADGRQVITCKLGDDIIVESSVQSYLYAKIKETLPDSATEEEVATHGKTVTLCKELMKFIDSASKYFDSE